MPYDTTTVTYSTHTPYKQVVVRHVSGQWDSVRPSGTQCDLGQMKARLAGTAPKDSARSQAPQTAMGGQKETPAKTILTS
jgi:hypothetical protein